MDYTLTNVEGSTARDLAVKNGKNKAAKSISNLIKQRDKTPVDHGVHVVRIYMHVYVYTRVVHACGTYTCMYMHVVHIHACTCMWYIYMHVHACGMYTCCSKLPSAIFQPIGILCREVVLFVERTQVVLLWRLFCTECVTRVHLVCPLLGCLMLECPLSEVVS